MKASDAVMIARGDLGVETPAESVPIEQRRIIGLGQFYGKPTIVATQMMGTMTENPEPSRAEVSDVATAVILGTDAVMLSDETANGKYPIEAVMIMKKIICYTEKNMPLSVSFNENKNDHSRQSSVSKAIISLAENIEAVAIVAETKSGATAINIASYRSEVPVIAVTSEARTAQQLAIAFGIKSYERPVSPTAAVKLTDWLRTHKIFNKGDVVVTASGQHPGVVGTTDTIKVRMLK
jgi:pyruvate kinase